MSSLIIRHCNIIIFIIFIILQESKPVMASQATVPASSLPARRCFPAGPAAAGQARPSSAQSVFCSPGADRQREREALSERGIVISHWQLYHISELTYLLPIISPGESTSSHFIRSDQIRLNGGWRGREGGDQCGVTSPV